MLFISHTLSLSQISGKRFGVITLNSEAQKRERERETRSLQYDSDRGDEQEQQQQQQEKQQLEKYEQKVKPESRKNDSSVFVNPRDSSHSLLLPASIF